MKRRFLFLNSSLSLAASAACLGRNTLPEETVSNGPAPAKGNKESDSLITELKNYIDDEVKELDGKSKEEVIKLVRGAAFELEKKFVPLAEAGSASMQYYLYKFQNRLSSIMKQKGLPETQFSDSCKKWLMMAASNKHPEALYIIAGNSTLPWERRFEAFLLAIENGSISALEFMCGFPVSRIRIHEEAGEAKGFGRFKSCEEMAYYWMVIYIWLVRYDPEEIFIELNVATETMLLELIVPIGKPVTFEPFQTILKRARTRAITIPTHYRPGEIGIEGFW